ncbi:MAG: BamA/TamA family outer membrane protein [Bacteroidales bacterium]|nr:BamA/TamA family outer membrane protein [Bacteroidales bacterium]
MKNKYFIFFIILLLAALITSCNSSKKVQRRGGYLLVRNSVKIDNPAILADEVEGFIHQKATPGRLSLLRPGVWIYEKSQLGKQTRFKQQIREKYGTAPVILDTNLASLSEHNIKLYLVNKGYHHPIISHDFRIHRANASATYRIISGLPYIIDQVLIDIKDSLLSATLNADMSSSLIKKGMVYDTYLLDAERDRIIENLRNQGYYDFSKADFIYKVDTSQNILKAKVTLSVRNLESKRVYANDSSVKGQIPRYYIRDIYIVPDVEQTISGEGVTDTVIYHYHNANMQAGEDQLFYFIQGEKPRLKPIAVASVIAMRTGQLYSQEKVTQTYKRMIGMPIFRSANLSFSLSDDSILSDPSKKWLDCNIKLTRNPVNLLSVGTEGTTSGGSLGMGFNTLYQNRNIFRRAETFRLKVHLGAELQGNLPQSGSDQKLWLFNTLEAGFETGIDLPRLLLPAKLIVTDRNFLARTSFTAGYGFESRPDYSRNITTFSASYHWSSSQKIKHIFTPLELNYVGIQKDSAFQAYLNSLTDPQFIGQYNDHLLTMIRYSLIFSNLATKNEKYPFFLRINAETSGNGLNALDQLTNRPVSEGGYYERFGVRYAQYVRADADFRKFWKTESGRTFAVRFMAGTGIPYGNSVGIPFEKSFWLGGANDMRGWKLRTLGPGAYTNDSVRYDRTGDIMLFSSFEYRLPVYSFLNAGIFMDMGNIWLRQDNPDFPGGTFRFSNVANQLAMNTGLGLRFDFSFFIFRLDWAFRIKNPEYENQWFHQNDFRLKKAVWNFGIGYPF